MTDKALKKLGRKDLLTLLVEVTEESEELSSELQETKKREAVLFDDNERFKQKITELEEQLERLKKKLDDKDATILALQRAKGVRLSVPNEGSENDAENAEVQKLLASGMMQDSTLQAIINYVSSISNKD